MKRVTRQLLMVCLTLSFGTQGKSAAAQASADLQSPQVIARLHWVGFRNLTADTNGHAFKEIWNLPASKQLRDDTLDRLSASFASHFEPKNNQASCAGLLRPLLSDLSGSELYLEVTEHPGNRLEWLLALRLSEERHREWQANWSKILSGWKVRSTGADRLTILATNSWFTVRLTAGAKESSELPRSGLLERIQQGQQPVPSRQEHWLELNADLARCSHSLMHKDRKNLPQLELAVVGRKDYLRSQARLHFREPLTARVEKWEIPFNTIRDPLISFTALQGFGPWLKGQPLFKELGLATVPNQLYLWGLSQTAFQIQAAVPVSQPDPAFDRIVAKWVPRFNQTLDEYAAGKVARLTNRAELVWHGLPILVPYLHPRTDGDTGYLHGGIFPVNAPTNPPPPQLFQQLTSQTNLLYYDWEITQARLNELRPLLQLGAVFLNLTSMSTNSSANKWLDVIEPRLGNTVTEVQMSSPHELQLIRTSHLGFNALELLSLANWLEGTNFPHMNLDLRFRPVASSNRQKPGRPR